VGQAKTDDEKLKSGLIEGISEKLKEKVTPIKQKTTKNSARKKYLKKILNIKTSEKK